MTGTVGDSFTDAASRGWWKPDSGEWLKITQERLREQLLRHLAERMRFSSEGRAIPLSITERRINCRQAAWHKLHQLETARLLFRLAAPMRN